MYEPPIRLLVQQLETSIREQQEKQIFEAIQKCGVDVDRDELIKALSYDRDQYDKGYADGRADAQRWISMEDRLPERDKDVLCFFRYPDSTTVCQNVYYGNGHWLGEGSFVTHWMPLPKPPEQPA